MTADVGISEHGSIGPQLNLEAGDLLVSYLEKIGVEYVFGIPGGAIEPLYNALARSERRGGIKAVSARHESGAAFMAQAYSRNTGKLGVCCATTGPGSTNLITGLASAYENQNAVLAITAQTALKNFGRNSFQESADTGINITGMLQFCTNYNSMITHPEQLERKLVNAITSAFGTPNGPAHLSIPIDILSASISDIGQSYNLGRLLNTPSLLDEQAVRTLCDYIKEAKKVVFVLGGGAKEAMNTIVNVASSINALIVTTPDGKGLLSPYHPLYRGTIGFAGHGSAQELLSEQDVMILAVGTIMGEWTSNGWDTQALLNDRLVHVDACEPNLARTPMARLHVRGDICATFDMVSEFVRRHFSTSTKMRIDKSVAQQLESQTADREKIEQIRHFSLDETRKFYDDSIPLKPQWLMHKLPQLFPPNTRYLADTGNSVAWAIHYLHPFDRRMIDRRDTGRHDQDRRIANDGLFQCALEFGTMGWAIGNSIGVALACPGEPIVCITGDGSFLMNGQEITVAKQLELPIIFIILNDSSLGMVRHGQKFSGAEAIGTDLGDINFSKMAQAMGITGYRISTPDDLVELNFDAICARKGPTLLDVRIDCNESPPMQSRMKVLKDSLLHE